MKKRILTTIVTITLCFCTTTNAFAGWFQEDGRWKYRDGSKPPYASTAKQIDGKVYYFDENGYMVTGWKNRNGYWYHYGADGALTRDQWINGTYYVGNNGRLFVNEYTSDGYFVGSDGKYDPTVDRLNGPGGMISKQPASAYTGEPLDSGSAPIVSTDAGNTTVRESQGTQTSQGSEDLSAWNLDFPLYMAMSDSLRAQASDVGCIAINRGDSDMVIYSAMARTTNDILGKAATRYMYLTYSNDGATWHKALSVRIKPQEQIYLNFVIVGDPIVSGISTSLNYVVEYHGVAYIVSKEPEQEKTWSVPLQSIYPNGEFTLANFQNNTWPQEIKAIFGIN